MNTGNDGPVARICPPWQTATASKILGLPVLGDDRDGPHAAQCGGCAGQKTSTDCPYSVARLTRKA